MLKIIARLNCGKHTPWQDVFKGRPLFTNIMTEPPFLLDYRDNQAHCEKRKSYCYREQPTRDEMQVAGPPVLAGEEGGSVLERNIFFSPV